MGTPSPNSPNALWAKYNFEIERIPRRGSGGHHRIIRDPGGRVVLQDVGHADELKWINDNLETIPND